MAGGPQHGVPEAVHSQSWSRELLEHGFVDDNDCVQWEKLLVLLIVDSKCFLPHFCLLDQFVTDPLATVIRDQMISLYAPFAKRMKTSCCHQYRIVNIFLSFSFNCFRFLSTM